MNAWNLSITKKLIKDSKIIFQRNKNNKKSNINKQKNNVELM